MKIEQARLGDASAISACVCSAYEKYVERMGKEPGPMVDDYDARIRGDHVWVVRKNGNVAGALVIIATPERCLLDNVAVSPRYAGLGIGKQLVRFAENWARDNGYDDIVLYTHERMTENLGMYQAWGYVEFDRISEKGFDRIYMRKSVA